MKLRTNFALAFDKWVPVLSGSGWLVTGLGLSMAVFMVLNGFHFLRENPGLKVDLEQLQKEPLVESHSGPLPSTEELQSLHQQLKNLNSLKAGGVASVTSLLNGLEKILPPGARLLSLQQDRDSGEVQLVVEALSLEELSRFLAALENDRSFSKVTLTKQSRSQNEKGNWIQFSLDLVEDAA